MDNIVFDFSEDANKIDDRYKTVNSTKQLAQLNDEIKEITNFPNYNMYDDAIAIINGHYLDIGFDHQDAILKILNKYKVKPESLIRGFIDMNNKIVFIFTYIAKSGAYLKMAQRHAELKKYTKIDNNIINNIDDIAEIIKRELNINKVYALHCPKGNQVQRLAKLIQ